MDASEKGKPPDPQNADGQAGDLTERGQKNESTVWKIAVHEFLVKRCENLRRRFWRGYRGARQEITAILNKAIGRSP